MKNEFLEFEECARELTELEKYILVSKDKELLNYFRKNGSYPKHKIYSVFYGENIYDIASVKDFHIDHAETLELPDAYFCGIRANHFALIYVWKEQDMCDPCCRSVIILANHKGDLCGEFVKFFIGE